MSRCCPRIRPGRPAGTAWAVSWVFGAVGRPQPTSRNCEIQVFLSFARRFRQSTHTTPHEFVLQQRVERAKTLLDGTNTALPDIASVCGFADQSHMTREFRKRVSVTPGRYRTQSR